MKLGFITACFPELTLEEIVKWASSEGFLALEVACWPSDAKDRAYAGVHHIDAANLDKAGADKIKKLFESHGMEISSLAYYPNNLDPDTEKRKKHHDHLKKVIDAASLLGVKLVGTFTGRDPKKSTDESLAEFSKVFPPLVKYASDKKVKLMIENCPMMYAFPCGTNFAYSPAIWEQMFKIIPKNLGLNYDPSHLYWLFIDYLLPIKCFRDKIFHVHAKDTEILRENLGWKGIYAKDWWRYRIPGLGSINWGKFISELGEAGFDGVISIEHEDPVWEGSIDKVKKGLVLGRRHLSQFIA